MKRLVTLLLVGAVFVIGFETVRNHLPPSPPRANGLETGP